MDRRWIVLGAIAAPIALILLFVAAIVFIAGTQTSCGGDEQDSGAIDPSTLPDGPVAGYGTSQLANAAQIMRAGKALNLTLRDQTIGVMTAMGESSLRVLNYGDAVGPDSRGLFQQRANGAWGSLADRTDPYRSATSFFKALQRIDGRDALEPTILAHRVQRNADPYHYRKYWKPAQQVVAALGNARTITSGTGTQPTGTRHYNLGPVKPQTQQLADLLGGRFDVKTIGGYRHTDPFPDHPSGLAIDLMVYGDRPKGQQIADYARAHADQLGVQYVIWYQHIWNTSRASEGWRPMADRGGTTANHKDHVHITLRSDITSISVTAGGDGVTACTSTEPAGTTAGGWTKPAAGPITDPYGWRIHPITHTRRFHYGTDLGGACDSPIRAPHAGTVVAITHPAAYGTLLELDHGDGMLTRYGHMYPGAVLVHVGDHVSAGQQIAKIGSAGWSTGCHVHVEVSLNSKTVDPAAYFHQHGITLG